MKGVQVISNAASAIPRSMRGPAIRISSIGRSSGRERQRSEESADDAGDPANAPYSSCMQFLMESLRGAPQKQMPRLLAAAA